MPIENTVFREILSRFASGVTVVTTANNGEQHGLTVSAFCSVSLDPPLVLVCIDRNASGHERIRSAGAFAVNILTSEQKELSARFASSSLTPQQRFEGLPLRTAATGAPILPDVLGFLDCELHAEYEAGDHTIFVGRVVDGGFREEGEPLVYWLRNYRRVVELGDSK